MMTASIATPKPANKANDDTERRGKRGADQADEQRNPRAINNPGKQIAPEIVGAEPMGALGGPDSTA